MRSVKLDSQNGLVRAIERWKRGFAVIVLFGALVLASLVVGGAISFALEVGGLNDWHAVGIAIGVMITLPWMAGDRRLLRALGSFARIADD